MKIVSRAEAKAAGLKRYFTGEPCKHGHVAERFVSNWDCAQCLHVRIVTRRLDPAVSAADSKRHREKHPELVRARTIAYQKANPKKVAGWNRTHYERHSEKILARVAAYQKEHPPKKGPRKHSLARKRAKKHQATCTCCTPKMFKEFYACVGKGYEVDHIKALALGGSHCMSNLQVLSKTEHKIKTRADMALISKAKRDARIAA